MKKAKNDNAYFFWSVAIILCAILALFSLMFASCASSDASPTDTSETSPAADSAEPDPDASTSPSGTTDGETSASPTVTELAETEDMGQDYIDKFIFLGDSTTHGLAYYDVVDDSQVWTPESGTLTLSLWSAATIVYPDDDSEISIVDAVTEKKPEYMLITLGVNGVSFMTQDSFITEYTDLVEAIQQASPDTRIILNSIYPVTAEYPEENGITNTKIDAANVWVESIAKSCSVAYTDSASVLKIDDGSLDPNLCNGDNIHLNTDGYNKVINYIRTHGWQ